MDSAFSKDLSKNNYIGKIVNNEDPDHVGRCKIRVYGLLDELEDDLLPWFSPSNIGTFSSSYGGGAFSVPKIGVYVRVRFANNDIYSGEYTCIQNVDPAVVDSIKDDYLGTHVICYDSDEELLVVFQPHSGITCYYKGSRLNLSPTTVITASTPNNNAMITLDNDKINIESKYIVNVLGADTVNIDGDCVNINANWTKIGNENLVPAVDGNALVSVLNKMAAEIEKKHPDTTGASGIPQLLPGILSEKVTIAK